jgi:hypothetical protein
MLNPKGQIQDITGIYKQSMLRTPSLVLIAFCYSAGRYSTYKLLLQPKISIHIAEPNAGAGGNVNNDTDSVFKPGSLTHLTTFLCSYISRYSEENKRTYYAYKANRYLFPNNNKEKDRLDLQHHLCSLTFKNKLYTY